MEQTKQAENEAFFAMLMPAFMDYVRQHSATVEGIELATSLQGISSMQCLQELGGVVKIVRVPLNMMTANVDEAEQRALAAAGRAEDATGLAISAAQNANDKAALVTAAVLDIANEKALAIAAAQNANEKADLANSIWATVKAWYESVNPAWTVWFNATQQDWETWFNARQTEWPAWYSNVRSTYEAWLAAAQQAENERQSAETAREREEATRRSNEVARQQAEAQRVAEMEELHAHPDKMGDNGNWWRWDLQTHAYVDTGVLAKGGILYPTFEIDLTDMGLYMYGSNEVSQESFDYDDEDGGLYFLPRENQSN